MILAAGIPLSKGDNTQLNQAISGRGFFKNHAMNGLMKVAQRYPRGVTKQFFGVTPTKGFVVDRWLLDPGGSGVCTASWVDIDLLAHAGNDQPGLPLVEGKFPAFLNYDQTSPGGGVREPRITQRIPDVRTLAGETVTLSFYARLAMAPAPDHDQFQIELRQSWGTGGAPSADTVYTSPTFGIVQSLASWTRYSFTTTLAEVQGKAFGANDDSFLEIRLKLGDGGEVFPLHITGIQLEKGTSPGALEAVPVDVDRERCLGFYEQSYPYGVTPGTPTLAGAIHGHEGGNVPHEVATRFRKEKATLPSVSFYAPSNGAIDSVDWAGSVYSVAAGANASTAGTGTPGVTSHPSTDGDLSAHWTAEAEL